MDGFGIRSFYFFLPFLFFFSYSPPLNPQHSTLPFRNSRFPDLFFPQHTSQLPTPALGSFSLLGEGYPGVYYLPGRYLPKYLGTYISAHLPRHLQIYLSLPTVREGGYLSAHSSHHPYLLNLTIPFLLVTLSNYQFLFIQVRQLGYPRTPRGHNILLVNYSTPYLGSYSLELIIDRSEALHRRFGQRGLIHYYHPVRLSPVFPPPSTPSPRASLFFVYSISHLPHHTPTQVVRLSGLSGLSGASPERYPG